MKDIHPLEPNFRALELFFIRIARDEPCEIDDALIEFELIQHKGRKTPISEYKKERMLYLKRRGLRNKEIGEIYGKSAKHISVILSRYQKELHKKSDVDSTN